MVPHANCQKGDQHGARRTSARIDRVARKFEPTPLASRNFARPNAGLSREAAGTIPANETHHDLTVQLRGVHGKVCRHGKSDSSA
jgi:hypothetical protein